MMVPAISSPKKDGRPERSLLLWSKSPASYFSNHLLYLLSETRNPPKTFAKFRQVSVKFLLVKVRTKYTVVNEVYQNTFTRSRLT